MKREHFVTDGRTDRGTQIVTPWAPVGAKNMTEIFICRSNFGCPQVANLPKICIIFHSIFMRMFEGLNALSSLYLLCVSSLNIF